MELMVAGSGTTCAVSVKSPEWVLVTEPPAATVDWICTGVIPAICVVKAPDQVELPVVSETVPLADRETAVPVGTN